ncbi:PIN domain-containing protein [Haloterrigena salinisoli]|uniref:type II toxin-antitoxin system VapC family toxin n=1 Tax=Haloterrigena salinisoli TaxID=3132747 RepID=UPI0030D344DF
MTTVPDRIVFDAEPLVAHAADEPGASAVAEFLDAVGIEDADGYSSRVNLSEVRYILARKYDRDVADEYLEWLFDLGLEPVDVEPVWIDASEHVLEYNPALGDSFALATAAHVDATLLVGSDDDYDEITDAPIERFRDGSV